MGEGVECGKVSHEHMVVNGIEGQGTEDKGTEKVVESGSPPIASHADGSGVEADSQAVASSSGVLVADSQVVASSSEVGGKIAANTSTPAREDLIDAYGFQLVVRKGKNVSVGREQSREMRILASAIQSRVPLNSKGVAMVIGRNKKKGTETCLITDIYIPNKTSGRAVLYDELRRTRVTVEPGIFLGDFNAIKDSYEASNDPGFSQSILDFRKWILDMKLTYHKAIGSWFTWRNKHSNNYNPIARRIDKILVNEKWLDVFPQSLVQIVVPGVSDHCGLYVQTNSGLYTLPKPFKFFLLWRQHPQYSGILRESWQVEAAGVPYYVLYKKLREFKGKLKSFNQTVYYDISTRTREAEQLVLMQNDILADLTEDNSLAVLEQESVCKEPQSADESFYRQKSRVQRITQGDANTDFFRSMVKSRNHRQTIQKLISNDGKVVTEVKEIGKLAVEYYKGLLGAADSNVQPFPVEYFVQPFSVEYFAELLVKKLTEEEAACLTLPVTREEIKHVFFSMGRDKAPGPNEFVSEFFKLDWEVVGVNVESTVIALIPKLPVVEKMKDFRPTSCCNVIYKGISKLLSRRLSMVLPKLIGRSQSAFVKGRLISDNILMATELVKDYHRSRISSRCALKIDLMKAFDSVYWKFLFTVMSAMGMTMQAKQIPFHPRCKSLEITQLCFADDLLVFTNGTTQAVFGIQQMKIKYYLIRLGFLWESYMFDIWECRFCQVN
ncbi:unnamed protein product [Linum trigynum]|uniref:Reverse transcriptase domain-containing protein n=1 Tax=Linum trigynum TaxID=586398 RepID=A0AAV2FZT7_9ROSI